MATTSRTTALRAALKTPIETQLTTDAITGVQVSAFALGDDMQQTDAVWFGNIRGDQEEHHFGGARRELLEAEGFIWVVKPGAGATIAQDAETRAFAILGSIETAVRTDPTVAAVVFDAVILDTDSEPGATPEGRYTLLKFTLGAEAHI